MRPWRNAAGACGLADMKEEWSLSRGRTLTARSEDLVVRLEYRQEQQPEDSSQRPERTRITVRPHGVVLPLSLHPESVRTTQDRKLAARDIETGDFNFDDAFYVTGPQTPARAALDAQTRRRLLDLLIMGELEVVNGVIRIDFVTASSDLYELTLTRLLRNVLDAARRLGWPPDVVVRLAENARHDPVAWVRKENLLTLVREFPEHASTRDVLRAACTDPSDDVRVRAATALGRAGRETLMEIAEREQADDAAAARAIAALGRLLTSDRVQAILGRALRARRVETARACLLLLGHGGGTETLGLLEKVLRVEKGGLAVAAIQGLAATGLTAVERPLIEALARDISDVRVAAAEALGRIGSPRAVLPLKEAEAGHPRDADLRRATRQAVAHIQSRAPGASPGQLSLAADAEGSLSLAEDERGRLSLLSDRRPLE